MKAKSSVVSEQLHPLRSQSDDNVLNSDGAVPYAITGEFGGIVKIILVSLEICEKTKIELFCIFVHSI